MAKAYAMSRVFAAIATLCLSPVPMRYTSSFLAVGFRHLPGSDLTLEPADVKPARTIRSCM